MKTIDIQELKESIGKKVYQFRKEKGYSARKFAMLAEMEHHQILAIEKGSTDVRLSTLIKMCNALEILPEELLSS